MIHSLQFWKDWPKVYQRFFWASAVLFIVSFLFLRFSYFRSPAPALTWQYLEEQELQEVPAHHFQSGPFDLTIHADNYLIFERLLGNDLQINPVYSYLFLALLAVGAVMILSVLTTLSRFWYFVGAGLFTLFLASLRFEIIQVFGLYNKTFTAIAIAAFVPLSYYFNAVRPATSFFARIVTFTFVTVALVTVIAFFAEVPKPFLHLGVTGITSGMILTIIFIFTVAHEIPASFVSIVTAAQRPTKSLNHFLIISTIYLVNLGLAYAYKFHYIDWDFLYIDLMFLFSVSAILGLWGFRQRQPQYEGIIDTDPFGIYFFVSMGMVAFGTIAYLLATANDGGLETIYYMILYSHIGFGVIFLTYVVANFLDALGNNLQVYRVLYKPARMPFFTFRFGGIIFTLALVFYNAWQVPVNNAYSAYYNAGGDLYMALNNKKLAQAFYDQGGTYGFLNHHSNYAIANIEAKRQNDDKERNFYRRASDLRPTEMSLLNYSRTWEREEKWLDAMLVLRDAAQRFPDSGPILNTQGLVYAKLNLLDSALLYLQKVKNTSDAGAAARTNMAGLAARHFFKISADSLYAMLGSAEDGVRANALAFANTQGEKIKMEIDLEQDTTLNLFSATLISNYLINHLGDVDSSFISKAIRLGERKSNSDYSEALLFASSLALYADGQVERAFQQLEKVIFYSSTQGKYNNIIALWALEQGDPRTAIAYLNYSLSQNYQKALQTSAIVTAEAGDINPSIILWDSVRRTGDSTQKQMSDVMLRVLTAKKIDVLKLNDADKYAYCHYRLKAVDTTEFYRIVNTIESEDYRARAIVEQSKKLYALDETEAAIDVLEKIRGLKIADKGIFQDFKHLELLMLARKNNYTTLAQQINSGITFTSQQRAEKVYYAALLNFASADSVNAEKNFEWLSTANPFLDDAIVASAEYFRRTSKDHLRGYTILVNALHRHPNSVKITKAYCLEAARLDFDEYAVDALARLQKMLPENAYLKFIKENRDLFTY